MKGLLTILEKIFSGKPVNEILSITSSEILESIGLDGIITSQRTNGFSNAVEDQRANKMNQNPSLIRLLRDVDAYIVPSGDEVRLLAGNLVVSLKH